MPPVAWPRLGEVIDKDMIAVRLPGDIRLIVVAAAFVEYLREARRPPSARSSPHES